MRAHHDEPERPGPVLPGLYAVNPTISCEHCAWSAQHRGIIDSPRALEEIEMLFRRVYVQHLAAEHIERLVSS